MSSAEDCHIVPLVGGGEEQPADRFSLLDQIRSDIQDTQVGRGDDLVAVAGGNSLRARTVLWTWSNTENINFESPMSVRQWIVDTPDLASISVELANVKLCTRLALWIAEAWEAITKDPGFDSAVFLECIVVKPEYHENGKLHLHALTSADQKTRLFSELQSRMKSEHGICLFARTSKSTQPFHEFYKYICAPSDKKPLILPGYSVGEIPQKLIDHCEKLAAKFRGRQCNEIGVNDFISKYISVIPGTSSFADAMARESPPALPDHDEEDPNLLDRFKKVQSWYIKNATKHAGAHVASCYNRIARVQAISWRSLGPKEHLGNFEPGECIGTSCQFQKAWDTMASLSDLSDFKKYLRMWYSNDLPYSGPSIGGRPRNIIFHGAPGCGKSFLESLLLFCIPQERVFRIKSGGFPFDSASEVPALLVIGSSDFRLNSKLDIETILLATEGKSFTADSKGKPAEKITGPVSFIMGSNNFFSGQGWGEQDIKALHDRFYIIHLSVIPQHMRLKSLPFCTCCAKNFITATVQQGEPTTGDFIPWIARAKRQKVFIEQMGAAKTSLESGVLTPRTFGLMSQQLKDDFFSK